LDRKELVRKYKETPRPAGVYRIVLNPSQRTLLGASRDARAMLNRTQTQLAMSSHPNRRLQNDWDVDGAGGFEFEVLDLLPPSDDPNHDVSADLQTLLELWMDKLQIGQVPRTSRVRAAANRRF
jgi:hypothetical protein